MSERARSFKAVAAEYERHRPDYPEDALRWAVGRLGLEAGARVLDVGAGTGKLTRGLVAFGFDVVAVEPGSPMLEQLRLAVRDDELPGRRSSGSWGGRSSRACRIRIRKRSPPISRRRACS